MEDNTEPKFENDNVTSNIETNDCTSVCGIKDDDIVQAEEAFDSLKTEESHVTTIPVVDFKDSAVEGTDKPFDSLNIEEKPVTTIQPVNKDYTNLGHTKEEVTVSAENITVLEAELTKTDAIFTKQPSVDEPAEKDDISEIHSHNEQVHFSTGAQLYENCSDTLETDSASKGVASTVIESIEKNTVSSESKSIEDATLSTAQQPAKEIKVSSEVEPLEEPAATISQAVPEEMISSGEPTEKDDILPTDIQTGESMTLKEVAQSVKAFPTEQLLVNEVSINEPTEKTVCSSEPLILEDATISANNNEGTVYSGIVPSEKTEFSTEQQCHDDVTISTESEPRQKGISCSEAVPVVAGIVSTEAEHPENATSAVDKPLQKETLSMGADQSGENAEPMEMQSTETCLKEKITSGEDLDMKSHVCALSRDEVNSSASQSLVEENYSCTSALMKLAELACRDELNDLGIGHDNSPTNNSSINTVSSGTLPTEVECFCSKESNNESPVALKSQVSVEPVSNKIEEFTTTVESDSCIQLNTSEITDKAKLTASNLVNNSILENLNEQDRQTGSMETKNTTSTSPSSKEILSMERVCMKCKKLWDDRTLMLLFEGTEPVTVHSSITFGALLCMRSYAHKNKLPVDDAVKIVLDSANFGQKLGSESITTLCDWINKLIFRHKIRCCDRFSEIQQFKEVSSSGSNKGNNDRIEKIMSGTADRVVENRSHSSELVKSGDASSENVNKLSVHITTVQNVNTGQNTALQTEHAEEIPKIIHIPQDSLHKLYKLISPFKSNGDYLHRGSPLPVKLYLTKEKKSMPKLLQSIYDSLYFNVKYFTEIDGSYYRQTSCNELIICCVMSFDKVEGKYKKKLLHSLVSNLLSSRGKILLMPTEEVFFNYVMKLATERVISQNIADTIWDKNEVYSASTNCKEDSITIRDVVANFCAERLNDDMTDIKLSLCESLISLSIDDIVGYCVRVYAIYCDIAFREQEESKARFLLNLPAHSNYADCIVASNLDIFPPNCASSLDSYKAYYQRKLSTNFDYDSLSKENQDILLEEISTCRDNIIKFSESEDLGHELLAYVEENAEKVGTKRKRCEELEFSKPVKCVKSDTVNNDLLKDVIARLSNENIDLGDLPRIVGIVYRQIYKMEVPSLVDIQDMAKNRLPEL